MPVTTSFLGIFATRKLYHLLAYSLVFGSTTYQSFFAGIRAYKTLDRASFAKLQSDIFPKFFAGQTIGTGLLAATLPWQPTPMVVIPLTIAFVGSLINALYLGPVNRKLSQERLAMAEAEGVAPESPDASPELKNLRKRFMKAHGESVLVNLAVFVCLAIHCTSIARFLI